MVKNNENSRGKNYQCLPHNPIMDTMTEWFQLSYEVLSNLNEKDHKKYCELWCEAHPIAANAQETETAITRELLRR